MTHCCQFLYVKLMKIPALACNTEDKPEVITSKKWI